MNFEYYRNSPMHMAERRFKMIIAKKPHLINILDRNFNHPPIRKFSNIPHIIL